MKVRFVRGRWQVFLSVLLLVVSSLSCLLYGLGSFPLKDWDEAIYTEVALEILRTGDWLSMHYNHEDYFNKPPLYFWCSQFVLRGFGFSEFTGRLPSAIFAGFTLVAVVGFARQLGGWVAGITSGFLLISSAMFLENGSRHASPDSLLLCCSITAIWFQHRARMGEVSPLWSVFLLGLAVMTKGVAAVPLALTLVLLHILIKDYRNCCALDYLRALGMLTIVIVPWYALQFFLHGTAFWQKHFIFMVWKRATQEGFLHSGGAWYYPRFLFEQLAYLWPTACLPLLAFLCTWNAWNLQTLTTWLQRSWRPACVLVVSAVTPVVLFSLAKNHTWWYILPSLPPICIAGGLSWGLAQRILAGSGAVIRIAVCVLFFVQAYLMAHNIHTTLHGQILNGIRSHGPVAVLAKQMDRYAGAVDHPHVILAAPFGESPTVATYVERRVEFQEDYLSFLQGHSPADPVAVLVLDKAKNLQALPAASIRVQELAREGAWMLALLETRQKGTG